jgi:hypothetical protein
MAVAVIRVVSISGGGWSAGEAVVACASSTRAHCDCWIRGRGARLGRAKQRQMGSDRGEGGRGHADHLTELIEGLKRRA